MGWGDIQPMGRSLQIDLPKVTVDCDWMLVLPNPKQHQMSWMNELIAVEVEQHFRMNVVNCESRSLIKGNFGSQKMC